jgi:hypothetical protein
MNRDPHTDGHVLEIVHEMIAGHWRTGASHEALAAKWDKPVRYVLERAKEAGRFIRLSALEDIESVRGHVLAELEGLCADARAAGQYSAAIRGLDLKCRLLRLVGDEPKREASSFASFGSAREALAFIESVLPELRMQAAAECRALPDAPNGGT